MASANNSIYFGPCACNVCFNVVGPPTGVPPGTNGNWGLPGAPGHGLAVPKFEAVWGYGTGYINSSGGLKYPSVVNAEVFAYLIPITVYGNPRPEFLSPFDDPVCVEVRDTVQIPILSRLKIQMFRPDIPGIGVDLVVNSNSGVGAYYDSPLSKNIPFYGPGTVRTITGEPFTFQYHGEFTAGLGLAGRPHYQGLAVNRSPAVFFGVQVIIEQNIDGTWS